MTKPLFLTLTLTSTLINPCLSSTQLPEISWKELSIGQKLGQGGLGVVYEARWRGMDVVVKLLSLRTLRGEEKKEFELETQAMWSSKFTNILRLLALCKEDDHYSMVFERMSGGSLYDRLHSSGVLLSGKDLWDIATRVAHGLANLHENGVIHRDLNSHNILLDEYGRARIADFGLASVKTKTMAVTQYQGGSIRWSAPECFDDVTRITVRSDIYSYGMILWELLTGEIPFKHFPKEHIVMGKVHNGTRETIPETCHPLWREIIEGCWNSNPLRRPSASKILDRLRASSPQLPRSIWLPAEEIGGVNIQGGYQCIPGQKADWERVVGYYQKRPVRGYDVGAVDVIWEPSKNKQFEGAMKQLQHRRYDPGYVAKLNELPQADWRNTVHRLLTNLVVPYSEYEAEDCPDVRLLPLWSGVQDVKLRSMLRAGHITVCETEEGNFGKGVYTSPDAAYAEMCANEFCFQSFDNVRLILNWVVFYNCFLILGDDYDQSRHQLKINVPSQYDARYIPIVQVRTGSADYRPAELCEPYHYRLFMTENVSCVLPRYVVRLVPFAGSDSQIKQMYMVLLDDLQKVEAKERIKLHNKLLAENRLDPEWDRICEAEKCARTKVVKQFNLKLLQTPLTLKTLISDRLKQTHEMKIRDALPTIAEGYEDMYYQFLNGHLFYRPDQKKSDEKIEFRIRDLPNPLFGTFDIGKCGLYAKYFQISTGFRTAVNPENSGKVEIWIVPQFVLQKDYRAKVFNDFLQICDGHRNKPFAVLFNWGGWQDLSWFEITGFAGNEFDSPFVAYSKRVGPAHLDKQALRSSLKAFIVSYRSTQRTPTASDGDVPENQSS